MSAHPTPLYTNPHKSGPENTFSAQNKKTGRFTIFDAEKGRGCFLTFCTPPSKEWASSRGVWGGVGWGGWQKLIGGMLLLDKTKILQRVKQTIQPLEVGCANRPKRGGVGGVFP